MALINRICFLLISSLLWNRINMFRSNTYQRISSISSIAPSSLPFNRIRNYPTRLLPLVAKLDSSIPFSEYSKLGKQITDVSIEAPSLNTRRITASILIDSPLDDVWAILTDYNNLATHVPNLVDSHLVSSPPGTIRLFQEGAQKIIGFDFRASLVMDMTEEKDFRTEDDSSGQWKVGFKLVESRMFDSFDGSWALRYHSRVREHDPLSNTHIFKYKTKLTYTVFVRPRGPVPVFALEWRIREDIPINLFAVKIASEKRHKERKDTVTTNLDNKNTEDAAAAAVAPTYSTIRPTAYVRPVPAAARSTPHSAATTPPRYQSEWTSDETLQSYIQEVEEEQRLSSGNQSSYPKKVRVYQIKNGQSADNSFAAAVNTFFGFNTTSMNQNFHWKLS